MEQQIQLDPTIQTMSMEIVKMRQMLVIASEQLQKLAEEKQDLEAEAKAFKKHLEKCPAAKPVEVPEPEAS